MLLDNVNDRNSRDRADKDIERAGGSYTHTYTFDQCFGMETGQVEMFEMSCKPLVDHVVDGFNSCAFAYGQTGSGKTYR